MSERATLNDSNKGEQRQKRELYFYQYCAKHGITPTDDLLDLFLEGCVFSGQQLAEELQSLVLTTALKSILTTRRREAPGLCNLFGLLSR